MYMLAIDSLSEAVISALEINVVQMLIQIAATIVLVVVVKVFFWSKITSFLEKRQAFMASELEAAKAQNEEAKSLKESAFEERQVILARSKEIVDAARIQGEAERNQIIMKAKEDVSRLVQTKTEEIEMEREKARADLRNEVIDLAVQIAEKIIKKEIDDKVYQDMSLDDFERSEEV